MNRRVLWCLVAVALAPRGAVGQATPDPAQNVLAGSRVFGAKGCGTCHAINGLGGDAGPDLGVTTEARSFYDFAAAMWNHLPGMVGEMRERGIERPRLRADEAANLAAFLFWVDYFDPAGSAERGETLFRDKQCVACHQVGGVGGVAGPSLDFLHEYGSPIQVAAVLWNHGPQMAEAMREIGIRRPTFTSDELTDLIAYLRAASPVLPDAPVHVLPGHVDEGERTYAELGCSGCHGEPGQGGGVGPDLGGRERRWSLLQFASAMWNKAPAMLSAMAARGVSAPEVQAGDMANIVAYLSSVQYFSDAGSAARGPRRIRAKGCLECHTLNGPGAGRGAGNLARPDGLASPAAVIAAMWNHTLITEEGGRQLAWPVFTAGEMADLAAFLQASGAGRREGGF